MMYHNVMVWHISYITLLIIKLIHNSAKKKITNPPLPRIVIPNRDEILILPEEIAL